MLVGFYKKIRCPRKDITVASEPPFLIGHIAHRELETLSEHLDQYDFKAVRQWAHDNDK